IAWPEAGRPEAVDRDSDPTGGAAVRAGGRIASRRTPGRGKGSMWCRSGGWSSAILERALVAFTSQRLVTECVIFVVALVRTLILLSAATTRRDAGSREPAGRAAAPG